MQNWDKIKEEKYIQNGYVVFRIIGFDFNSFNDQILKLKNYRKIQDELRKDRIDTYNRSK